MSFSQKLKKKKKRKKKKVLVKSKRQIHKNEVLNHALERQPFPSRVELLNIIEDF